MECEVCGKEIYGKAYRSIIDGAKLIVCSECSQFASSSWKPESKKPASASKKISKLTPSAPITRRQLMPKNKDIIVNGLELIEDYSQKIRKGREQLNLTHEILSRKIGERVSVLQKLETGKMIPNLALVKKLENTLKVKLLETLPEITTSDKVITKNKYDLTLGDVVIIQKSKKTNLEEEERKL